MNLLPGPLDAGEGDPFAGTGVGYDLASVCRRLEDGEWVVASLHGLSALSGGASLLVDPVAGLSSSLAGWAMEHVGPLRAHLDDLAGDPAAVMAGAGRLLDSGQQVEALAATLGPDTARHLEGADGLSVAACRCFGVEVAGRAQHLAQVVRAAGTAVQVASGLVDAVRSFLRDAIAEVIGMATSSAVTVLLSGGVATVAVGARVAFRVAQLMDRAGDLMRALVRSFEALRRLLGRAEVVVEALARVTRSRRPLRVPDAAGASPMRLWERDFLDQLDQARPAGLTRQAVMSAGIRISDGPPEGDGS